MAYSDKQAWQTVPCCKLPAWTYYRIPQQPCLASGLCCTCSLPCQRRPSVVHCTQPAQAYTRYVRKTSQPLYVKPGTLRSLHWSAMPARSLAGDDVISHT